MKSIGKFRIALLVGGAFVATPLYAQDGPAQHADAAPSGKGAASGSGVAEIIVTAQRRAQNLQNVPVAITAISAESAQNLGIRNVVDVASVTPGASFTTGSSGFFQAYIRGIGANVVTGGLEAPVAIYEDGAYVVRNLNVYETLDNFDIGSIQVLRGPQGTLYGRNATGGVVIINSADPTDQFEGRVRGEFGNLEHRRLDGMINVPLGQDLSFRGTASYRHEGGYIKNVRSGEELGGGRSYNLRGKLRWQPEGADIILGAQYQDTRYRHNLDIGDAQSPICLGCTISGIPNPTGYYTTNSASVKPITSKNWGANLSMTFDIGQFDLSSVTTYRHQKTRNSAADSDYSGADLLIFTVPQAGGTTFTQDFQVTSKLEGRLNYIFGLSYIHDKSIFNPVFVGDFFPPVNGQDPGWDNTVKTSAISTFAEGYYDVTDQLKVTVGGRYTYQERSFRGDTNNAFAQLVGLPGAFSFTLKGSERAFTPRFVLAWDNGPTNIYYSFTRGYKAGGFAGPAPFPVEEIRPEKIFSHEIGIKQQAFGGKGTFNLSIFYLKNKDQQTTHFDLNRGGNIVENAGAMENYGAEAELQLHPMDGLNINLAGAWQHARYKPYRDAAIVCYDPTITPSLFGCSTDLTGTVPPHSPTWKGSASISYDFAIGSWTANLSGLADYRSRIEFFPGAGGVLRHDQDPSRVLINASGFISPPGEKLRLGFYANNVFNKKYWLSAYTQFPYGTAYEPALPRTYGLRVEYRF